MNPANNNKNSFSHSPHDDPLLQRHQPNFLSRSLSKRLKLKFTYNIHVSFLKTTVKYDFLR